MLRECESCLFVFLLAAISSRPQSPRVIVDHVSQHNFLGGHIYAELDLNRTTECARVGRKDFTDDQL